MGNILHDWNLEKKQHLIRAAYDALPSGGALVAIENVIDDDRRLNAFGLLMSLNMLIEVGDGFDYTGADFAVGPKPRASRKPPSCRSPARRARPSLISEAGARR